MFHIHDSPAQVSISCMLDFPLIKLGINITHGQCPCVYYDKLSNIAITSPIALRAFRTRSDRLGTVGIFAGEG